MKTRTLFCLGALATIAAALGNTLLSLLWFAFGNASLTTPRVWFDIVVDGLFICGLIALLKAPTRYINPDGSINTDNQMKMGH